MAARARRCRPACCVASRAESRSVCRMGWPENDALAMEEERVARSARLRSWRYGRAPARRPRAAAQREPRSRQRGSYAMVLRPARERTTASVRKSKPPASVPDRALVQERDQSRGIRVVCGADDLPSEERGIEDPGQRAAGDQAGAEQRAGADLRFLRRPRSCARRTSGPGRRRRSARSSRWAGRSRPRTTASGCRRARA